MMALVLTTLAPMAILMVVEPDAGLTGPIFKALAVVAGMLRTTAFPAVTVWLGKLMTLVLAISMEAVVAPVVKMAVEFNVPLKELACNLINEVVNAWEPLRNH